MKAIKCAVPIYNENLEATLEKFREDVLPLLNMKPDQCRVIGSSGKKPSNSPSQDIDIAILNSAVITASNEQNIARYVHSLLKNYYPETKLIQGLNVCSFAFPIEGSQLDQYCQIDLMPVNDLTMANFYYWSPMMGSSKYSGSHRTILLTTIASLIDVKPIKLWNDKRGMNVPLTWSRYFLNPNGLFHGVQSCEGKSGRPCQTKKTLTMDLISSNPAEIMHTIIGPRADWLDVNSFEKLYQALIGPKFQYPNKIRSIILKTKENMNLAGLKTPREIRRYV